MANNYLNKSWYLYDYDYADSYLRNSFTVLQTTVTDFREMELGSIRTGLCSY